MAREQLKVAGFPEWLPKEQAIENKMKGIVNNEYQKYGYINIETPAVEKNEVLTAKSGADVSKQIFGLYGLAQGTSDAKEYSMHFDLTVPLARYIIDHENEIDFPFKRYQIQKVWRGERQQKGRFKEFYQCDVDVIDKNVDIGYDVEVIEVLYKTLQKLFSYLGIEKEFVVQMNNRKLFESMFSHFNLSKEQRTDVMRLFDDYYKMDREEFLTILKEYMGDEGKKMLSYLSFEMNGDYNCVDDKAIVDAVNEVKFVYNSLKEKGVNIAFDPFIVRGLDYYSGTVFETFIDGYKGFGSVCSGGRFDNLVKYIRDSIDIPGEEYGGVGGSIGLSRLLSRLLDAGLVTKKEALADVMIFNLNDSAQAYREEIAQVLRDNNIRVDVYHKQEKLGKQFQYAEGKNIPLGIFAGGEEEKDETVVIKNLNTRESETIKREDIEAIISKKLDQ